MKMDADFFLNSPQHAAMKNSCFNPDLSHCSSIKMLIPKFECIAHLESRENGNIVQLSIKCGHKRYRSHYWLHEAIQSEKKLMVRVKGFTFYLRFTLSVSIAFCHHWEQQYSCVLKSYSKTWIHVRTAGQEQTDHWYFCKYNCEGEHGGLFLVYHWLHT